MKHPRTGTTIMEMTVALVVLTAAVLATTQLVGAAANDRRRADRRQLARHEAANLMERVAVAPWAKLTNQNLQTWRLPDDFETRLPGARLQMFVAPVAQETSGERPKEPPAALLARKITLTIAWRAPIASSVTLVSWRFAAPPEAEPNKEDL